MMSKFLRVTSTRLPSVVLCRKVVPAVVPRRVMSSMLPPSQYDMPWPKRLTFFYVIRNYWETIPLFVTTAVAMSVLFSSIAWACTHKVDVLFSTRNRSNLSRTMDLRNPSVNKIIIINQRYAPWPEMQDALDKMKKAENRVLMRANSCPTPPS